MLNGRALRFTAESRKHEECNVLFTPLLTSDVTLLVHLAGMSNGNVLVGVTNSDKWSERDLLHVNPIDQDTVDVWALCPGSGAVWHNRDAQSCFTIEEGADAYDEQDMICGLNINTSNPQATVVEFIMEDHVAETVFRLPPSDVWSIFLNVHEELVTVRVLNAMTVDGGRSELRLNPL
eukprot:TRINITY_DN918_c0_g1_i2.p1 TRINITY_DN918_c0_g1~~TRINITY_DN918_c0_g1_i2.p1  ORF type:complete len:178 (+),score=37.04 TRINITY_DN918_c0_g1_i2:323-856(+)